MSREIKTVDPEIAAKDKNGDKVGVIFSKDVAWENWDGKIKDGKWVPHKKIKEKREKMWIPVDADIEDAYQPLNEGGMVGCPMDGAIMKGGTKIKPNRYKNGKREV